MELPSEQDLNPFSRYEALGKPDCPIVLDDIDAAAVFPPADKSPSDEGFTELELLQNDSGTENGSTGTSRSRTDTANTTCASLEEPSSQDLSRSIGEKTSALIFTDPAVAPARTCDHVEDEDEGLHNRSTEENVEQGLGKDRDGTLSAGPELSEKGHTVTAVEKVKDMLLDHESPPQVGEVLTEDQGRTGSSGASHEGGKETSRRPAGAEEPSKKEEDLQNNETEMSWLMKRMQGPIEGERGDRGGSPSVPLWVLQGVYVN